MKKKNKKIYKKTIRKTIIVSLFAFLLFLSAGCGGQEQQVTHKIVLSEDYSVSEIGRDITKISSPYGIVCREEDILVCDYSGNKIVILDMDGNYLGEAGTLGSGPLEFIRPTGITRVDQYIYVIDSGNNRLQVLDQELGFVREIELPDLRNTESQFLMDIVVTSEGDIYLSSSYTDKRISRIYRISGENKAEEVSSQTFFGYLASKGNQVYGVNSMELYEEKNFFGARSGESRLKNITEKKDISELPYKYCPLDFVLYGDSYYCLSVLTASLDRLDSEGAYLDTLAQMPSFKGPYAWVDVSCDGTFYITHRTEGSIFIVRKKADE